jgi:hypothetical protein
MPLHITRSRGLLSATLACLLLLAVGCATSVLSIAEADWVEVRSERLLLLSDAGSLLLFGLHRVSRR